MKSPPALSLLAYANLQPGKTNRPQSIKSSARVSGHTRTRAHGVTLVVGSFTMGDLSCGELMAPLISPFALLRVSAVGSSRLSEEP